MHPLFELLDFLIETRFAGESVWSGGCGELLDFVGAESTPVVFSCDDDGGLQVSQAHDVIAGLCVFGDVDDVVFDSRFVECAVRGIALHTCGLGIYGDRHFHTPRR
jgi:hypothetical protein